MTFKEIKVYSAKSSFGEDINKQEDPAQDKLNRNKTAEEGETADKQQQEDKTLSSQIQHFFKCTCMHHICFLRELLVIILIPQQGHLEDSRIPRKLMLANILVRLIFSSLFGSVFF